MIEVKHLYKSFEDREVLKDINTVFEDGKTNLIIGQSGSGKTVLMKNLVGLFEPTRGEILYDGRNFVSMSKHEKVMMRREMGMIFQSAALFDSMTVLENVMFPLDMFSSMTLRERIRRAQDCLGRVNLTGADENWDYYGKVIDDDSTRVVTIMLILNMGSLVEDDFDQIFNLLNDAVLGVGDVLGTFIYRQGVKNLDYGYATAVELFRNIISLVLVLSANFISKRINEYGLW